MNAPHPSRKRRKDARPAEFLTAALGLFVEKGYTATRLEEIAQRAGASKGTLYLYFKNKEALFQAVIQEGVLPIVAESEALAAKHEGSSFALLEHLLDNWWMRIGTTDFAGIPKLMIAEASNFPEVARFYYENVILRTRALLARVLERGFATGEFRRMDPETCIDLLIAPILMLVIWRHSLAVYQSQPTDPRQYLSMHMNLLRQGLLTTQV